jgi:nicotinamide-nucleotide adenylyltransferase
MTRAVVVVPKHIAPGTATATLAAQLLLDADEVVVAVDDNGDGQLLARTTMARSACMSLGSSVWVTALPATALHTSTEPALLTARLGRMDRLVTQQTSSTTPPVEDRSCALVVVRAQPFHLAHLALIEHAATVAEEVAVVVAAAEQSFTARDPFTAGERLQLVRAGTMHLHARLHLVAMTTPIWPALALPQLAGIVPSFRIIVGNNPVLAAMARHHGVNMRSLPRTVRADQHPIAATAIRTRLAIEGVGPWLAQVVPAEVATLLSTAGFRDRCRDLHQPEPR